MKKTYIKIYGPPMEKAIVALEGLTDHLPRLSRGAITKSMIVGGEPTIGDYDFVFEWSKDPTKEKLITLMFNLDEVLGDLGCRYTMVTK